jgi:hypothetical protein
MISTNLLIYCVALSGLYLLIVSFLLDWLERKSGLTAALPSDLLESLGFTVTIMNFFMEAVFYIAIPAIAYSFFYSIIPLAGVRAGLSGALFAFVIGAVPAVMRLSVRIKLPMPYLLYLLLAQLIKMAGCMAIIGYLYSL